MIIQSNSQRVQRRNTSAQVEEVDDDPWSGYQDTLELEITAGGATEAAPASVEAMFSNDAVDEFAAAKARLKSRGKALQQQSIRDAQQRSLHQPRYFAHLEQHRHLGNHNAGRVYGVQPGYYQNSLNDYHRGRPVTQQTVTTPALEAVQHQPEPVMSDSQVAQANQPQLPYEIDAWGNPILPENAELDAFGNMYYRYS